jgi:hypothetical protein
MLNMKRVPEPFVHIWFHQLLPRGATRNRNACNTDSETVQCESSCGVAAFTYGMSKINVDDVVSRAGNGGLVGAICREHPKWYVGSGEGIHMSGRPLTHTHAHTDSLQGSASQLQECIFVNG